MIDYNTLRSKVQEVLKDVTSGNDYAHVVRVFKNAIMIAQTEKGVDVEVLKTAALLHDISYGTEVENKKHGEASAEQALSMLSRQYYSKEQIEKIQEAIRVHDYWYQQGTDAPIEVKILRDADKLDALGHTGILRTIAYASMYGKNPIQTLKNNLNLVESFETKKGKELAKPRMQVYQDFLNELQAEY